MMRPSYPCYPIVQRLRLNTSPQCLCDHPIPKRNVYWPETIGLSNVEQVNSKDVTFSRAINSSSNRASMRSAVPLAVFRPITSSLAHSYPSSISSTLVIVACAVSSSPSPAFSAPGSPAIKRSRAAWFEGSKNDTRTLCSRRFWRVSDGVGVTAREDCLLCERLEDPGDVDRSLRRVGAWSEAKGDLMD